MISLLVCSRFDGNENNNLANLISSLNKNTTNPDKIELLIKIDDNDSKADKLSEILKTANFKTDYIVGAQNLGYISIHEGYSSLLKITDRSCLFCGAVADDMVSILKGWDEEILKIPSTHVIIHGRPHPRKYYKPNDDISNFKPKDGFFNVNFEYKDMEELYVIDEAPFWSKSLLDCCNHDFLISFTDVWTLALEKMLWDRYKKVLTYFIPQFFYRNVNQRIDSRENKYRWEIQRRNNFNYVSSKDFEKALQQQAENILYGPYGIIDK